jgi:hypothetical protein
MQGYAEITAESIWGHALERLASRIDVKTIVEIGTLDGTGSTRVIINALLRRYDQDTLRFITIEAQPDAYQLAIENNKNAPTYVKFLNGNLLDRDSPFQLVALTNEELVWWSNDLETRLSSSNVIEQLPERIDLLVLDGGEFSTLNDYLYLRTRSKILYLDDTNARKNRLVKRLAQEDGFRILIDHVEGKGFCVLEKAAQLSPNMDWR